MPGSPTSAQTGTNGSLRWSAIDAPTPSAAPTRFTSSAGPPRHSMPCVERRGTPPAAEVTPAITGGPMADAPPCPPDQRWHCDARGTRCGRTRRTSPTANRVKLEWIAKTDPRLYRAYLLKEGLRTVFKLPADQAGEALDRWGRLGTALPHRIIRHAPTSHRWPAHPDPRPHRAWPIQR